MLTAPLSDLLAKGLFAGPITEALVMYWQDHQNVLEGESAPAPGWALLEGVFVVGCAGGVGLAAWACGR